MPRARTSYTSDWQTAASTQGSGCLSGFLLPPLAVLMVGVLLAFFVKGLSIPVQAESLPFPTQANGLPVTTSSIAVSNSTSFSPIFTPEIHYWAEFYYAMGSRGGAGPEPGCHCDANRILW